MNYMAEVEYGGEMIGWDPVEDPQPEKEPDVVLADPRPRELLSISQWVSKHYYWSGLEKASCILKLEERPLADAVALDCTSVHPNDFAGADRGNNGRYLATRAG
jgi:hypothetical protein